MLSKDLLIYISCVNADVIYALFVTSIVDNK